MFNCLSISISVCWGYPSATEEKVDWLWYVDGLENLIEVYDLFFCFIQVSDSSWDYAWFALSTKYLDSLHYIEVINWFIV